MPSTLPATGPEDATYNREQGFERIVSTLERMAPDDRAEVVLVIADGLLAGYQLQRRVERRQRRSTAASMT